MQRNIRTAMNNAAAPTTSPTRAAGVAHKSCSGRPVGVQRSRHQHGPGAATQPHWPAHVIIRLWAWGGRRGRGQGWRCGRPNIQRWEPEGAGDAGREDWVLPRGLCPPQPFSLSPPSPHPAPHREPTKYMAMSAQRLPAQQLFMFSVTPHSQRNECIIVKCQGGRVRVCGRALDPSRELRTPTA